MFSLMLKLKIAILDLIIRFINWRISAIGGEDENEH